MHFSINGQSYQAEPDIRTSVLDLCREHLGLTGSKKGCDHGQCGACTVLINGRRVNSCLTLAVMQAAFVVHDGYQCGYCTPGQICSAVGMLDEVKKGWASNASADLTDVSFDDAEISERMSGNLCRCSAYPNIVDAIREVAGASGDEALRPARQPAEAGA
jgi:xanthine dehydrogenase YagT iron-sulfur-binding subunit